jgi:hypothetical protein
MSATIPAPIAAPLFYTLPMFKAAGLPGRTRAYELANAGLLKLVKDGAGRVGITRAEAERFFAAARPIAEVKRDLAANRVRRGEAVRRVAA